jgi:hypothetical protein
MPRDFCFWPASEDNHKIGLIGLIGLPITKSSAGLVLVEKWTLADLSTRTLALALASFIHRRTL